MPPKRKSTANKVDKPEHEVKKQKLSEALDKCVDDGLPDEIEADAECPVKGNVYIDREAGIAYDCMLNQSNVGNNNNKYFILQVIENKFNPNSYTTWFRWGRVGYPGQNNITNTDLDTAISLFKKKFKDKTGNVFGSATFTKKAGKYDMIKLDYGKGKSKSSTSIEVKKEEEVESKLCPEVKAAIDLMCDMSIMGRYLKSSLNFDSDKCPLGNISKAQVKAGYELLTKIEAKMLESKFDEEYEDLVNQYYTKIPHNFGFKRPKMIKTLQEFKEELALLEALSDIEITTSAMKEKEESVSIHPSDQNYQRLKCELTPLKKTNPTYKMIETYLKNTKGPTHHQNIKLHNVFEIKRESEAEQYMGYTKSIGNRHLLWHGSGLANWFGILSQGLRIAPPEAPVSGYMFGKGVYFADCCSKSASYCRASNNQKSFMTLAEVALGNSRKLKDSDYNASDLPKGHHSTHGVGKNLPDQKQAKKIKLGKNDVVVPMGKIVPNEDSEGLCLYYNEFIVYNTSQICLRYLLEVEFTA